jgi:hypothetical protein
VGGIPQNKIHQEALFGQDGNEKGKLIGEFKRILMLEQQDMQLISHPFLAVIRGIVFY